MTTCRLEVDHEVLTLAFTSKGGSLNDVQLTASHREELERVSSNLLPTVLMIIAGVVAFAGGILVAYAFKNKEYWVLGYTLSSFLGAAILFGFADVVQSLRSIAKNGLRD